MRALVGLVILVLAGIALLSAHERKPFVTPIIDPTPAAANIETIVCAPVTGPWVERPKKIVRT